jgi:hypothetical protein
MYVLVLSLGTCAYHVDSEFYKESVTLVVGASKTRYTLHKGLLCFYSDFFRAAFNGSFKEAIEFKLDLPDTEIDVFEAFQFRLYSQTFPKNEVTPTDAYPEFPLLARIWVFSDKYQIPLLQNNAIDTILAKVEEDDDIPVQEINLVYRNTLPNSPLRKAFTDIMVYQSEMPISENSNEIKSTCLGIPTEWPK